MPPKRKKSGKRKRKPNGRRRNKHQGKIMVRRNTKSKSIQNENIKPEYHCFVTVTNRNELWSVLNYKDAVINFYLDKLGELEGIPYDSINILSYHKIKQCGQEIKLFKHKDDLNSILLFQFRSKCDRNYWHNAIKHIINHACDNKADNSENNNGSNILYISNTLFNGEILTIVLTTCSNDLYLYKKYDINTDKNRILVQKIKLIDYNQITLSQKLTISLFKHKLTLKANHNGTNIVFHFKKNNERQEWFTHLDFIMNHQTNPYMNSANVDQKDENKDNNDTFNKSLNILLKILKMYNECNDSKIKLKLNISYVDILNHFHNIIEDFHSNIDMDMDQICTKSECVYANRHQIRHQRNQNERNKSNNCELIAELLDKIHCFIFHSDLQNREENTIRISRPNVENKFIINTQNIKNEEKDENDMMEEIEEMENNIKPLAFAFGEPLHFYRRNVINYINAYYSTLKEELILNPYYKLSINEYYNYYTKALNIKKTKRFQNIKAINMDDLISNEWCEISMNDKISINHIIALMTYCNETELQRIFKQQTRKANNNESKKKVFKKVSFICHWIRYLDESCVFYGKQMQMNQFVYCGMDRKLIFNTFNFTNYSPISTSSEITVANNFASNNGIILKLQRNTSGFNSRYFDMLYISDYIDEKELFFCGNARFSICDIIISGKCNSDKILSLKLLELILNGNIFVYTFNKQQFSEHVINGLIYLLDKYIKWNDNNDDYFVQLTHALIQSYLNRNTENDIFCRKILFINFEEIKKLKNSSLLSYFSETSDLMRQFKEYGIRLRYVQKVFRYRLSKNKLYQLVNNKQYECILGNIVMGQWRLQCSIDRVERTDYITVCIEAKRVSTVSSMEVILDIVCEQIEYQTHQVYRQLSEENGYFAGVKIYPYSMLCDLNCLSIDLNLRFI